MGTATLKTKNAEKVMVKKSMTYTEALEMIEQQNVIIREVSKVRTKKPDIAKINLGCHGMLGASGAIIASGAAFLTASSFGDSSTMNFLGALALMHLPALLPGLMIGDLLGTKHPKYVAPRAYRKALKKHKENELFHTMAEEDYLKMESEVLRKTRKALKIINENLALDGSSMEYSNEFGNEGFHVRDTFEMNEIEKLKIRSIEDPCKRKKVLETMELQKSDPKALTI